MREPGGGGGLDATPVTLEELEGLLAYRREMAALLNEINAHRRARAGIVNDSVKESRHDVRADIHTLTISGLPAGEIDRREAALTELYWRHRRLVDRVEGWVMAIEDMDTRTVFRLRYLAGESFSEIADLLWHGRRGESYPRKCIHDRYLKQQGIMRGGERRGRA